ncbi:MAG TPA: bifunctional D-glycero-beta-D-manno-heptose-7-phosphate kinase/D-glycero-beta-D-manno-heptose 1-phosphate adenylyltransferase HldE [Marinospirillum sp.]|uniref:bifunctional D-glycero-beta-D-manno-heptose-7-phosphate kinase/D-glycero-beta-D-manno-heptose 1-phosphate adenylyltransferase HldE n=1 Tax=Marinospirillum sp. TaxID=2183934 RepID=UPI002B4778AA|nr:bifunctional D-glycero-beta-D-manno-heptose-7-phosphate kinase/D-glycero-beta-D-manno-heptose 1-phosphate adenylyltransferase HldE [Marinospirillum sp.]HKM14610.1 bifunctional D-glycero-beta-D-manno-heptose-7-phosphate kinase/D-glycero-beta-D-manno-heptose 1-phosphate adenylyltransferase HldE [Marinospirillum sp.]
MKVNFTAFEQATILVAGDVMLDRYWQGATHRISPEAPVPVVKVQTQDDRLGGAANVALNLVSLGAGASLVGIVGQDANAQLLDTRLDQLGIKTLFDRSENQPTITKIRIMSRNQQLIRLDFEEKLEAGQSLLDAFKDGLKTTDLVILSDYAKGTLSQVQQMIQMARQAGKRVLVDPKGQDFSIYRQASVLTPNLSEFEAVVGVCKDEAELEIKGEQLRSELALEALLITRSEKGMTLIREGLAPLHLPTRAQEIYDVTGAGDTVIAVLGLALASGHDFPEAMMLANLAAGLVVAKPGTATVSLGEIYTALHSDTLLEYGVIDAKRLAKLVAIAKTKGEKVVFTNGCFDLLHAGHVAYLEEAHKLGDRLIVAVNSDASVSRLKGASRPINALDNRMRVLAGLQSVDWVVPFEEDTPAKIIAQLMPNVLVKGGDYQVESIAGADTVLAAGGEVKVLTFVDGVSTTAMVRSILDKH